MRFRDVRRRRRIAMYLVNQPRPPVPSIGQTQVSRAEPFVADGWIHPRPADQLFDVGIRVPSLTAGTTITQRVLEDQSLVQGGVIRRLGYFFSQPHGYLQVRTTVLINGAPPIDYLFRTVDAVAAGQPFQGSLPPFQIGTPIDMTEVFIKIPSQAVLEVRFVNASATETFSFFFRLWGWLYTT